MAGWLLTGAAVWPVADASADRMGVARAGGVTTVAAMAPASRAPTIVRVPDDGEPQPVAAVPTAVGTQAAELAPGGGVLAAADGSARVVWVSQRLDVRVVEPKMAWAVFAVIVRTDGALGEVQQVSPWLPRPPSVSAAGNATGAAAVAWSDDERPGVALAAAGEPFAPDATAPPARRPAIAMDAAGTLVLAGDDCLATCRTLVWDRAAAGWSGPTMLGDETEATPRDPYISELLRPSRAIAIGGDGAVTLADRTPSTAREGRVDAWVRAPGGAFTRSPLLDAITAGIAAGPGLVAALTTGGVGVWSLAPDASIIERQQLPSTGTSVRLAEDDTGAAAIGVDTPAGWAISTRKAGGELSEPSALTPAASDLALAMTDEGPVAAWTSSTVGPQGIFLRDAIRDEERVQVGTIPATDVQLPSRPGPAQRDLVASASPPLLLARSPLVRRGPDVLVPVRCRASCAGTVTVRTARGTAQQPFAQEHGVGGWVSVRASRRATTGRVTVETDGHGVTARRRIARHARRGPCGTEPWTITVRRRAGLRVLAEGSAPRAVPIQRLVACDHGRATTLVDVHPTGVDADEVTQIAINGRWAALATEQMREVGRGRRVLRYDRRTRRRRTLDSVVAAPDYPSIDSSASFSEVLRLAVSGRGVVAALERLGNTPRIHLFKAGCPAILDASPDIDTSRLTVSTDVVRWWRARKRQTRSLRCAGAVRAG